MHARLALASLFVLSACNGTIGDINERSPNDPMNNNGTPDASVPGVSLDSGVPVACEPEITAIPKLLRLSNHEYKNMVSDLLGAPVDDALFARWTPVAEVYGFDTMSETRVDQQALEEQLATSEALATIVLATPSVTAHCAPVAPEETPACAVRAAYSSRDDFSDAQDRECWTYLDTNGTPMIFDITRSLWRKEPDETALLWREGAHPGSTVDVIRRWHSPYTGTALLTANFTDADPGGGDGILVSVRLNDQPIFSQDVPNGGSANFSEQRSFARGDRVDFVIQKKVGPEYDTTAFSASLDFVRTPRKAGWDWASCAQPLVSKLASRAFRRPVRAEEAEDYRAMFEAVRGDAAAAGFAEPVDHALLAVVQAILLSPNFVFKPELVPNGVDANERNYAIASRLSLYFRSSIPDDVLWALAAQGGLTDEAGIRAQASRLLAQDLGRFATNFGGQWLAYRDLAEGPLAESMRREANDVFAAVLSENLMPERLMKPGFTLVDPELAAFYGLTLPGDGTSRVVTDLRGGLLSQAGFLSRTGSGSEFRRPIHRGLWVLTRLMCQSLPRLDPATREEIGESFGAIDPNLPLPEKMALHRNTATRCGGCHSRIDPIGLGLEKYDERGLWRETYTNGAPIVTDLELNGMVVRDPHQLATAIESSPEFRNCVSTKLFTFALNRGPLDSEMCVAERVGRPLDGSTPTLQAMAVDALIKGLELTEVPR